MTKLILPAHVASAQAYAAAREEFNAQVHETAQRAAGVMRDYDARLRRIDPRLRLVYWGSDRPDMPLRKGYWYIVRDNGAAPVTFIEIHADGEPCEPNSRIFDKLAEGDLWNTSLIRESLRRQREELARAEADRMRADEERRDYLRELVDAATRVQVSMNRDKPWAQNHAGEKRRGGGRDQSR